MKKTTTNGIQFIEKLKKTFDIREAKNKSELDKLLIDDKYNNLYMLDNKSNIVFLRLAEEALDETLLMEIFTHKTLIGLELSQVNLDGKITNLSNLNKLEHLVLSRNKLTAMNDICELTNLIELTIIVNNIATIPESIKKLKKLKKLILVACEIEEIPDSLGSLPHLQTLFLLQNNIKKIPDSIFNAKQLKILELALNKIKEIPDAIENLQSIIDLSISHNKLEKISPKILDLKQLKRIDIDNNPISDIFNTQKKVSQKELLSAVFKLQHQEHKELLEAKLLIVGDERNGKTSLVRALRGLEYDKDETTTNGINIDRIELTNKTKLNIWDFAGQEITHQTHQFFLTTGSVYLLVLNAEEEDKDANIYTWLNTIKANGKDSPIIVAINKTDKKATHTFDVNRYKADFNITNVIQVSAKTGLGIPELKKAITSNTDKLKNTNLSLPSTWIKIKEKLEKLPCEEKQEYIEINEFEKICNEVGADSNIERMAILNIFNEIGTIVTYANHDRLHVKQILNPLWVTEGVYSILRSPITISKHGKITEEDVTEILSANEKYKATRHGQWLIDLLIQFELAFDEAAGGGKRIIFIPSQFEPLQPKFDINEYTLKLSLVYRYENILKKNVIAQFIVKMNHYIDDGKEIPFWQRGVFLKHKTSRAVVISDENKKTITIHINTKDKSGTELLTIIREKIREINGDIFKAKELIPLMFNSENVGEIEYEELEILESSGDKETKRIIDIGGKKEAKQFIIAELLNGYRMAEMGEDFYKKLYGDILSILAIETENRQAIFRENEDATNRRVKSALLNRQYNISDQSQGGESGTGISVGERDIVIRDMKSGVVQSIIEALVLHGKDDQNVLDHYNKLINKYDTVGNKDNYLLIYSKNSDFNEMWNNYKKIFGADLIEMSQDDFYANNIKIGHTKEKEKNTYHIFVNFYSKQPKAQEKKRK